MKIVVEQVGEDALGPGVSGVGLALEEGTLLGGAYFIRGGKGRPHAGFFVRIEQEDGPVRTIIRGGGA